MPPQTAVRGSGFSTTALPTAKGRRDRPRGQDEGSVERRDHADDTRRSAAGEREPGPGRRKNVAERGAGERGALPELLRRAEGAREVTRQPLASRTTQSSS